MLVLGSGPTQPIQFAELESSRTSPFTWLTPAVLALHLCVVLHTCPHAPSSAQQPAGHVSSPVIHWAQGSHLCTHYLLIYVLFTHNLHVFRSLIYVYLHIICIYNVYMYVYVWFIYPWYNKWSEPSRKYSSGLKRAHAEIKFCWFPHLSTVRISSVGLIFPFLHSFHSAPPPLLFPFHLSISSRKPFISSCATRFTAFLTFDLFSTWK